MSGFADDSFILFVNDGSKDRTWELIEEEHKAFPIQVCGVKLAGHVGHQFALTAGLITAKDMCDVTVSIDADLQDDVAVIEEMIELKRLGGSRVHPILWITPQMLKSEKIDKMFLSDIEWQGIKIHPEAHNEWSNTKALTSRAINIAVKRKIPFMIHTGEDVVANAITFENYYAEYPQLQFILAHGKPFQQALNMLKKYNNITIDSAFMNAKDVNRFCKAGFPDKIIFGSDAPINKLFYKKLSTQEYIKKNIYQLRKNISPAFSESILSNTVYFK